MAEITLAKALKIKNRLAGRLAKAQADIQAYNSVPQGQADQVNVPALMQARAELVGALVGLKAAINDANREAQRDIYDLAEKKATAQFLAGVNTRHGVVRAEARHRRHLLQGQACDEAPLYVLDHGAEPPLRQRAVPPALRPAGRLGPLNASHLLNSVSSWEWRPSAGRRRPK
jgi:hypothetical protein